MKKLGHREVKYLALGYSQAMGNPGLELGKSGSRACPGSGVAPEQILMLTWESPDDVVRKLCNGAHALCAH